jgi:Flp pilus assembly protein TadD
MRARWVVLVLVAAGSRAPDARSSDPKAGDEVTFVDEAAEAGILVTNVSGSAEKRHIVETTGSGACFLDYDSDGDMDLYIVNGDTLDRRTADNTARDALYQNLGGGEFVDVTTRAGVGDPGWGGGCYAGDYDNDGDPDLYITNFGRDVLYRNEGDGTFREVTRDAGLGDPRWSSGAAFLDFDRDGRLDLYVANYLRFDPNDADTLARRCRWKGAEVMCGPRGFPPESDLLYHNEGGGVFSDVTGPAGIAAAARFGLGVVVGDLDDDQDADILVANDSQENLLWVNDGHGHFTDRALSAGVALSADGRAQAGMGAALGDFDDDGDEDFLVTNFSDDYDTLYRNEGGLQFSDVSLAVGLDPGTRAPLGWAGVFLDYDNDGDLDLFVANGHVYPEVDQHDPATSYRQRNLLFANEGGRFVDVTARSGPGLALVRSGRGAAVGDYDDDGDLDLLVVNENDAPSLLRNDGGNRRHWLKVRLVGRRSNRDGIGARLYLEAGGRRQLREARLQAGYYSSHDPRIHFGLGTATVAARLRIRWPSGREQVLTDLPADHLITVDEEKGMVAALRLGAAVRSAQPRPAIPASSMSAAPDPTPRSPAPRLRLTPPDLRAIDALIQRGTRRVLAGEPEAGVQDYELALARLPLWGEAAASPDALGFGDPGGYRAFLAALHDNLGVALMRAGRVTECRAAIEQALAIFPGHAKSQRNLALCHFHGRRYDEAAAALRAARDAGAKGVEYDLGRALALGGDCAAAQTELERALAQLPRPDLTGQRAEAWYHLGGCRLDARLPGDAVDAFREALSLMPGHQKALYKLERSWRLSGESGYATRVQQLFLARQPADEAVRSARLAGVRSAPERLALVRAQLAGGRPAAALTQLGMILAADPGDAALLTLLGDVYLAFRPSAHARAEEVFRRALRVAPGAVDALAGLGEALRRAGRADDAEAQFQRALALAPDHPGAIAGAALVESHAGKRAAARARLEAARQRAPGDPVLRRALAAVSVAEGDRPGGAAAMALLDGIADPFDESLETRVRALVLLGQGEGARTLIQGSPFLGAAEREGLLRLVPPG